MGVSPTTLGCVLACGLAAGCGEELDPPDDTTPTYYRDVAPIFHEHCGTCHTAGGIAPFATDDPEAAVAFAPAIGLETSAGRMPPWPPGPTSPAMLHERRLGQAERDVIAAWAAAGAPLGDPTMPGAVVDPEVVDIGPTELGFDIGVDYVPDPSLTDDYRCFVADTGAIALRYATGYQVTPGNRATVHHVIVSLYAAADLATLQSLDAQTPERDGWPCVGGAVPDGTPVTQVGSLGGWVPGVSAVAFPEGTGNAVVAGAVAVVQVHYNLRGGTDPDRTRIDVALAPASDNATITRLGAVGLARRDLLIGAGLDEVVQESSFTVAQWRQARGQQPFASGGGYLLGASGHMHMLGSSFTLTRTDPTGDTVLLDIPDWNFHWQGGYQYTTPIRVENADTLTIRCVYDNSSANRAAHGLGPPVDVTWGEGTEDEMCLGSLMAVEELP